MEYKPGSFFLTRISGVSGYLIALAQAAAGDPSRWTHAGIVISEAGDIVEAETNGARLGNLSEYVGKPLLISDAPVQMRLAQTGRTPDDDKRLRYLIVTHARSLVGTPYSFADYAALGLLHLHLPSTWVRRRVETSGHLICSALVDRAMCRAGIHLFSDGRYPGDVLPADLAAIAEDWAQQGVVGK